MSRDPTNEFNEQYWDNLLGKPAMPEPMCPYCRTTPNSSDPKVCKTAEEASHCAWNGKMPLVATHKMEDENEVLELYGPWING